jgi:hypothetical protein
MEDKVREWLETQGYPLEMQVARTFQECGFRVIQGEYYSDPATATLRETDVVASMVAEMAGCHLRVSFVAECKSQSADKPWILFTRGARLADPARVAQRAASENGQRLLLALANDETVQSLELFQVRESLGGRMLQARRRALFRSRLGRLQGVLSGGASSRWRPAAEHARR